jgi:hypothetical protein
MMALLSAPGVASDASAIRFAFVVALQLVKSHTLVCACALRMQNRDIRVKVNSFFIQKVKISF